MAGNAVNGDGTAAGDRWDTQTFTINGPLGTPTPNATASPTPNAPPAGTAAPLAGGVLGAALTAVVLRRRHG